MCRDRHTESITCFTSHPYAWTWLQIKYAPLFPAHHYRNTWLLCSRPCPRGQMARPADDREKEGPHSCRYAWHQTRAGSRHPPPSATPLSLPRGVISILKPIVMPAER
ncbi:hypothetical protein CDAR_94831 [Caerostris darwini]|uniref:Uncharacterized protein n=1 Tax=Caerostris darwini TaxID=1538125 RepID=A0AAV4PIX4_9ARAC|nr:hypothetical protein CDAR_94831 [Caerostris darwini]